MRLDFSYPTDVFGFVWAGVFFLVFVAIAHRSAEMRRLPIWYTLYGLLLFTGCVYVASLDSRLPGDQTFRKRIAESFCKHPILLGLLTLLMGTYLVIGSMLLLSSIVSFFVPCTIYVNNV